MVPASPAAPHGRRRPHRLPLALTGLAVLAAAAPLQGQIAPEQLRRDVHEPTISPRFGPPGTEVTFRAVEMPYAQMLLVGVGVLGGGGHQMVGQGGSDADGVFELVVKVPEWAEPGTSHYFFVATADQRPRAMAPVFLVSDADGVVRASGEVGEADGACGRVLTVGTDRFGLVGETGGLREGASITVEGTVVERPGCEGTPVIEVRRVLGG